MREGTTLLSDFDVAIDDSLLTSEPDVGANNIEQIVEIAKFIGKKVITDKSGRAHKREKKGHTLTAYIDQHKWCCGVIFGTDTLRDSPGPSSSPGPQCEATLANLLVKGTKRRKIKTPAAIEKKRGPHNEGDEFPTKKHVHRSKEGCWTCRLRHKACPEDGHPCGACARLGLECDVARQRPFYMVDAKHAMQRLKEIKTVTDRLRKSHRGRRSVRPV